MSFAQSSTKALEAEGPDLLYPQSVQQPCWAAVSFDFADATWCDWIYREFDGTRIPRPLMGRPSRFGNPYPDRISVSPDPADPQQLESYADTLRTAQHLIIVISPNFSSEGASQEHMRLFRASGGEERIIALVVKGEPASASAEAGCAADIHWLPKWLEYRFKDNAFEPGPPSEPLVIDARLGVSSLAEVRAKICAALLEVPVTQLSELGVAVRSNTVDFARQASPVIVPMPEPTPLPTLASFTESEQDTTPRHSRWPVYLCSAAALAALGFLFFWPAKNSAVGFASDGSPAQPTIAPENRATLPPDPKVDTRTQEASPMVAVVPVREKTPEISPGNSAATPNRAHAQPGAPPANTGNDGPVVASRPVSAPAVPTSVSTSTNTPTTAVANAENTTTNPTPKSLPTIEPGIPIVMTPESDAAERKRYELASRRDRLVRLGESKLNAGETDEAIASFEQALETAQDLVNRTQGGHDEVIELALLYRRFGNVVTGVNSTAEGRSYFDRGRRELQALKAKGKLPREALKILNDLENLSRPARE